MAHASDVGGVDPAALGGRRHDCLQALQAIAHVDFSAWISGFYSMNAEVSSGRNSMIEDTFASTRTWPRAPSAYSLSSLSRRSMARVISRACRSRASPAGGRPVHCSKVGTAPAYRVAKASPQSPILGKAAHRQQRVKCPA